MKWRDLVSLALAAQLFLFVSPNPDLTPGRINPAVTQEVACTTKWGMDRRMVDDAMKLHVLVAYGLTWEQRGEYEIDHLIPRSLGGADSILNLWPQVWAEAYVKDALEVRLGKLVCAGKVPLGTAQRAMRNWVVANATYPAPSARPAGSSRQSDSATAVAPDPLPPAPR